MGVSLGCFFHIKLHAAFFQIEIQRKVFTRDDLYQVRRQCLCQAFTKGTALLLKIFVCGLLLLRVLTFFTLLLCGICGGC